VRSHNTQTGNVPMLYIIYGFLLHLGQYITDDFGRIVGRLFWSGHIDGHVGQLWPRERVVEVVFQEVVFGEVGDICGLNVGDVGWDEHADVHK